MSTLNQPCWKINTLLSLLFTTQFFLRQSKKVKMTGIYLLAPSDALNFRIVHSDIVFFETNKKFCMYKECFYFNCQLPNTDKTVKNILFVPQPGIGSRSLPRFQDLSSDDVLIFWEYSVWVRRARHVTSNRKLHFSWGLFYSITKSVSL